MQILFFFPVKFIYFLKKKKAIVNIWYIRTDITLQCTWKLGQRYKIINIFICSNSKIYVN